MKLLADNEDIEEWITLNARNGWSGSFDSLPLYHVEDGEETDEISYSISEIFTASYHDDYGGEYTVTYVGADEDGVLQDNGDGTYSVTITNTYTPETISIS